jgi:hypothetical protein
MSERHQIGERGKWIADSDDPDSVDDLFIDNCAVHLERMSNSFYWCGIYFDGKQIDLDIVIEKGRRVIRARVRR